MAHQQHPEIPVNGNILKAPINQAFFPITKFHHFHKDANINSFEQEVKLKAARIVRDIIVFFIV